MKIGILTYHRTYNYGGCLQALATRLVLEEMGHEVFYIDYWPSYHSDEYKILSFRKLFKLSGISKLKYLKHSLVSAKIKFEQRKIFEAYHEIFTYPYCKSMTDEFDLVIYGSDQIWRKQVAINAYNPIYFGNNNIVSKRHASYAASMGTLPSDNEDIVNVLGMLRRMDYISVREDDLKDFLLGNGFVNVVQVLDPTLLVESEKWLISLRPSRYDGKKYILVYALWEDVFNIDSVKEFAKVARLEVKILHGNGVCDSADGKKMIDPVGFIQLISNAQFVFTSSFHGLAFSIIFHRQFFVSIKQHSARVKSLLASLGLQSRFLPPMGKVPENMEAIDYELIARNLAKLKVHSMDYIRKMTSEL